MEEHIIDALESMHIQPQDVKVTPQIRSRRSSVKPPPIPEASLESLTTDTNAILNRLLQPGMMDNKVEEDERRASVTRWQDMIATPTNSNKKVLARMPGTLITPSTTKSSFAPDELSSIIVGTKGPLHSADGEKRPSTQIPGAIFTPSATKLTTEPTPIDLLATQEVSTASQSSSASSNHLVRSMSLEERHAFLNDLVKSSKAPPASVFVLPVDEIPEMRKSAIERGFHCRVHDLKNGDGWLIVGMDRQAVEDLFVGVEGGGKEKDASGGGFRAAVGGAIFGSVATWTSLAYT